MSLLPFAFGFLLGYTIAAGQRFDDWLAREKDRRRRQHRQG